jgi:chemotaxis family two-component system response regulator Rcp1
VFRILVVDDNPLDAHLIESSLSAQARPYRLDRVSSGIEALESLMRKKAGGDGDLPNIILMDLHMPELDGLRVLRQIKSDPLLCTIPVIMFSTAAQPNEISEIYGAQASCFVTKPANVELSERFVRAIEAFWMDFVVFAPPRGRSSDRGR